MLKARLLAQLRRKHFEDENRRNREQLLRMGMEAAEARASRELAETRAALLGELEAKNKELEAFSASVSHDLRAPLRSISGFSKLLLEDYSANLDETAQDYLNRVCAATKRMGDLIDALLELARFGASTCIAIDRSLAPRAGRRDRSRRDPCRPRRSHRHRRGAFADVDPRLVRVVFDNLFGNAVKFTSKIKEARIAFGTIRDAGQVTYFVRDNGVGFDSAHAAKLFTPFQRLHAERDFPGTGIGLATVRRILERHGGRVWAESGVGAGADVPLDARRSPDFCAVAACAGSKLAP